MDFAVSNEIEEIACERVGCSGCNWVHRRVTGRKFVAVDVEGYRFTAELVPGTAKWEAS